ncbi:MAG: selenocysteine-specific translation elongation factor [Alphaproteobacteria bacterium]|nr:selenocysteine-specific translation elongation factor [Alphaproteobacteria bacterium]
MIVATAGHVDHGKTSLVRRLTGVDTDRLPEEKRRGLTIELGFAYADLPDGTRIGFVDVPGHERFLRNMLAGVMGIDSALLVVAADDGPMPQTREHLAILDLIGVAELSVVVSKTDRVSPARVAEVGEALRQLLSDSGFPAISILPVSSETGEGIAALQAHLAARSRARVPRPGGIGFRLAVDRCFTLPGAGTIVTGTVAAGRARVGDLLLLTPRGTQVRVRSIHAQDRDSEEARTGERCALAIAGTRLDRAQVQRGDWIVTPDLHAPTQRFDAYVRPWGDATLRPGLPVHVHLGTADIGGRLTLLSETIGAEGGFVRIALDRETALLHGDRVVIRDHAARRTLAGGRVVDPFPPARHVARASRLPVLRALDEPDPAAALQTLLAAEGCVDMQGFARVRNLDPAGLDLGTARRIGRPDCAVLVSDATYDALCRATLDALTEWHRREPAAIGPAKATLLQALSTRSDRPVVEAVLADLVTSGAIQRDGAALRLPEHTPRLSEQDEALWSRLAPILAESGLRPPRVRELAAQLDRAPDVMERALMRFEAFGRVLRVAPNRFFPPETIARLAAIAETLSAAAEEGGFPAGQFAVETGIGRNLAIQVLEFLDRIGVTKRVGELRHVVRSIEDALG